jgi:putative membrane protein
MSDSSESQDQVGVSHHPVRVILGGLLMGLANLVPGVSGGTMILAMGLYEKFIGALADLSRLRFSADAMRFLCLIAMGAAGALLGLSGIAVELVSESRWVMYSLFIGMTLGGAPDLLAKCRPMGPGALASFGLAFALMASLAWGMAGAQVPENAGVLVGMGMLGASSMILPGISGSYMLLLFGMYDVVIGSLSVSALRADPMASLTVLVPVGIGAVLGMALLSNILKAWLKNNPSTSHAALLGLLVGSVLGLYPFREPLHPDMADRAFRKSVSMLVSGEELSAVNDKYGLELSEPRAAQLRSTYAGKSGGELKQMGDQLKAFDPAGSQIGISLGLLLAGFAFTRSLGRRKKAPKGAISA